MAPNTPKKKALNKMPFVDTRLVLNKKDMTITTDSIQLKSIE